MLIDAGCKVTGSEILLHGISYRLQERIP
jgi:hypothetical protein